MGDREALHLRDSTDQQVRKLHAAMMAVLHQQLLDLESAPLIRGLPNTNCSRCSTDRWDHW